MDKNCSKFAGFVETLAEWTYCKIISIVGHTALGRLQNPIKSCGQACRPRLVSSRNFSRSSVKQKVYFFVNFHLDSYEV